MYASTHSTRIAAITIARVLTTVPLEGLLIKQPTPLSEEANSENKAEELAVFKRARLQPCRRTPKTDRGQG